MTREGHFNFNLVGDEGFEPPRGGVKVRCLTAWLIPNVVYVLILNWG